MCYQDNVKMLTGKSLQSIMYGLRGKNKVLRTKCCKIEQQNKDLRYSFASFRKDDMEQISMLEDMLIELCEDIVEGVGVEKLQETAKEILSNIICEEE
jgi:hypothetical protein